MRRDCENLIGLARDRPNSSSSSGSQIMPSSDSDPFTLYKSLLFILDTCFHWFLCMYTVFSSYAAPTELTSITSAALEFRLLLFIRYFGNRPDCIFNIIP
jgi:hypothetical protein